jgi:hypothetical protein
VSSYQITSSEYILNLCSPHTSRHQVLVVNKSTNTNDALRGFHPIWIYIGTSTQHFGSNVSIMFICQVETVGQVYMAVSGAPEYTPEHAENVADVALCLLRQVKQFKLPSGISIQIRIGEFLRSGFPLNRPLFLIWMSLNIHHLRSHVYHFKQYKTSADGRKSLNNLKYLINRKFSLSRIPFFLNMTRRLGVIASRPFKTTYCLHLLRPVCPRRTQSSPTPPQQLSKLALFLVLFWYTDDQNIT